MDKWQELQNAIAEFADKTWPTSTAQSKALHLADEAREIAEAPDDLTEYADATILLLDAARKAGYSVSDLFNAAAAKLEVNKQRTWAKPDDRGVSKHIERRPK